MRESLLPLLPYEMDTEKCLVKSYYHIHTLDGRDERAYLKTTRWLSHIGDSWLALRDELLLRLKVYQKESGERFTENATEPLVGRMKSSKAGRVIGSPPRAIVVANSKIELRLQDRKLRMTLSLTIRHHYHSKCACLQPI
jgi:hypothetical protein